ncbi:Glycerophosphoryl diester phosphodiesterase [Crocosphaera watsonii WH 0402]|uniref:Glycerophosphoryl diester phosphodiesterase n=1 Tax=Crocosphaera watsonii WH 0402 TaxID=1284629 RepID=T2JHU2_CROWT|nr:Glycerophosphoryl diester phosphodiesterase [Crocosphaera watsonii WH 0402]
MNTPHDPSGVGGIILFSTSSETLTGTWTAQAIPEPLTILGSLTALGFGTLFKRSLKGKNNA